MSLNSSGGFRARSNQNKKTPNRSRNNAQHSSRGQGSSDRKRQNAEFKSKRRNDRPQKNRRSELREIFAGIDVPRAVAFDVVYRVEVDGAYANLALPKMLRDEGLSGRDAAFATELTYGTLRSLGIVDGIIGDCSSRGINEIHAGVLTALRLGAYQLLFTRVEAHAAVDTSVRMVEAIGEERAKGFTNGILRTISRSTTDEWMDKLAPQDPLVAQAWRHGHPEWIARVFEKVVGAEELEAALKADSERPSVHLVARPGEISGEELALITGGEEGKYSPYAVYLESGDPGEIEPVKQGLAAVQDEGSQLIANAVVNAELIGEDKGRWLDLCAGPGGKAAFMGSLALIDQAHVDAIEVASHRARLISQAVDKLPVTVHHADGRDPGLEPGYDRVLVDAPCSGLGALRRRPEARWRKQESDIEELNTLQLELLESALNLVRPGGVVVYSTCSPDLRETRGIVDAALAQNSSVEELDASELVPNMDNTGDAKSVQMWPHRHGTDAMFFAVLRKKADQ